MDQPANNAQSQQATGPVIFVVDDEPMLLELAVAILKPLGYELKTFRDPETALQAFTASNPRPSLVITDYAMHKMTGLELIRECRRINPQQKTILLSGTVDESSFRSVPAKPDRFLAKPYQAGQFGKLVQAVLAN